ncbi:unnamed protein product [Rhizophagus irregularis]|nr:unnamed protein product [Rhizophagus irregularis]
MHIQGIFTTRDVSVYIIGLENNVERKDLRKNRRISEIDEEENNVKRKNQRISEIDEEENNVKRKNRRISEIDEEENNVKRKDLRKNRRISDGENEDNNVKRKDLRKNRRISENEEKDNIAKRKNVRKYQQTSDDESAAKPINRKKLKDRRMYSESDDAEENTGNKYLSRRSDGPLINTESVGFKRYKNLDEMDKDLKEALRRDVFWNISRMPKEGRLDPSKTFESQQELVTRTIIPTIKQLIDLTVYPVNENVLYQIIYRRHRSQRDTYRINNKELEGKKRNQKENTKTRAGQFNKTELEPITKQNCYHSPEESDENNNIIVKDLPWHSDTLRKFLRGYLDKDVKRGKRIRVYGDHIADDKKPVGAPKWTISGYNGELKRAVSTACNE